MALTREDIIKDPELMKTLAEYGVRRNGDTYNSKEEAVDSFLEDYRAILTKKKMRSLNRT